MILNPPNKSKIILCDPLESINSERSWRWCICADGNIYCYDNGKYEFGGFVSIKLLALCKTGKYYEFWSSEIQNPNVVVEGGRGDICEYKSNYYSKYQGTISVAEIDSNFIVPSKETNRENLEMNMPKISDYKPRFVRFKGKIPVDN